jgi:DNA-binding transcriptional MerR regulator/methylmalonyl-CoA mutase cobalamin-binding subunit
MPREKLKYTGGEQQIARHPIKVVARRTGLSPDLIRAWERRYEAIEPQRSNTKRRLYTDADVEKLRLLRRATLAGRRIGDVASLSAKELAELVGADESAVAEAPTLLGPARAPRGSAGEHFGACLRAVEQLNAPALESALAAAAVALSTPVVLDEVIVPLLEHIGDQCHDGAIRISNEHMASAAIRTFLGPLVMSANMADIGPGMVVTTPAGQWHELGALMVAITASGAGWRTVYLGPNIPAEEIAFAATQNEVAVVALSIGCLTDERKLTGELHKLRRYLPKDMQLWVGGSGTRNYQDVLTSIGATWLDTLAALRRELGKQQHG